MSIKHMKVKGTQATDGNSAQKVKDSRNMKKASFIED